MLSLVSGTGDSEKKKSPSHLYQGKERLQAFFHTFLSCLPLILLCIILKAYMLQ